ANDLQQAGAFVSLGVRERPTVDVDHVREVEGSEGVPVSRLEGVRPAARDALDERRRRATALELVEPGEQRRITRVQELVMGAQKRSRQSQSPWRSACAHASSVALAWGANSTGVCAQSSSALTTS